MNILFLKNRSLFIKNVDLTKYLEKTKETGELNTIHHHILVRRKCYKGQYYVN